MCVRSKVLVERLHTPSSHRLWAACAAHSTTNPHRTRAQHDVAHKTPTYVRERFVKSAFGML